MSVEAGTAMLFAVTPVVLYPERLIFQRFFTACSATETIELKTFAGNLVKSSIQKCFWSTVKGCKRIRKGQPHRFIYCGYQNFIWKV